MTLDNVSRVLTAVTIAAIAIAMLVGCSLVDEDTSACTAAATSGSAIAFTVAGEGDSLGEGDSTVRYGATRTPEGTLTLTGSGTNEVGLRDKGFGVFASYTGMYKYASSTVTPNMMYNQQVNYDNTAAAWTYSPIVYWPNSDDGSEQYVTFFAYAPYSTGGSDDVTSCITDFSLPSQTGDPWLVYRLGGTEEADGATGWKACQQDLVYAFEKDQKRQDDIATNVALGFKHALASVGDQITLSCDYTVERRLKNYYTTSPVTLTVSTITVDYLLTPKGRLVLNDAGTPNWQVIDSGDTKVHRKLTFTPDQVMAKATSRLEATSSTFQSPAGNGIFYLPVESGSESQKATITVAYTIASDDPSEIFENGSASVSCDLSYIHQASEGRNISVSFKLPESACTGSSLALSTPGMIICSHGKAHAATTGSLDCGGEKVAVVVYRGSQSGASDPYINGLAMALRDLSQQDWASAIDAAPGYCYAEGVVTGAHPTGTSRWFLPDEAQWQLMVKAMTSTADGLAAEANSAYVASALSTLLTNAGAAALSPSVYWSATEISETDNIWTADLENGCSLATPKTDAALVRPVLAF